MTSKRRSMPGSAGGSMRTLKPGRGSGPTRPRPPGRGPRPAAHALTGLPGDRGAAGKSLDAAPVAAVAERPVDLDHDVAELPRGSAGPGVELAAQDQASADPGRDRHVDQVLGAPAGAA